MGPTADGTGGDDRADPYFPAYGPVEAILGYLAFFAVVDRTTPAVVEAVSEALPGVSPSLVGLGLASALWFVLALSVLDQARRQLAALGVLSHDAVRPGGASRIAPTPGRAVVYVALFLVGAAVAVTTFDRAVEGVASLVSVLVPLDVPPFPLLDLAAVAVFFVAVGVASRSLDRLILGGIRTVLHG